MTIDRLDTLMGGAKNISAIAIEIAAKWDETYREELRSAIAPEIDK